MTRRLSHGTVHSNIAQSLLLLENFRDKLIHCGSPRIVCLPNIVVELIVCRLLSEGARERPRKPQEVVSEHAAALRLAARRL